MLASGFSGISITQFHIRGAPSSSVICRLYNYIFSVVSEILDGQWRFLYGATFVIPYNLEEKNFRPLGFWYHAKPNISFFISCIVGQISCMCDKSLEFETNIWISNLANQSMSMPSWNYTQISNVETVQFFFYFKK